MGGPTVELGYVANGDLLWLGNGMPTTGGAKPVTLEPDFDAFSSEDGKCVGVYLYDAARILLMHLTANSPTVKFHYKELCGTYSRVTDTLDIGNGKPAASIDEMAEGLDVSYGDNGRPVGFTLRNAAGLLLHHLQTWHEPTAEEMTATKMRMAEHLAAVHARMASPT